MQEICRKHSAYRQAGIPSELIDAQSLARIEPALRPGLTGALLMPEDVVVSPQPAARFLLQQAHATLVKDKAAAVGSGRVTLSNGDELRAPILIQSPRRRIGSCGYAPAERVLWIEDESRVGSDEGRARDTGDQVSIPQMQAAFEDAADDAFLAPDLTGSKNAFGMKAG